MARCCGSTGTCACKIEAGRNIEITGTGSSQEPYVVASDVSFSVEDSLVFDLGLVGAGTLESPWRLSVRFSDEATLDDLPDVDASDPTNSQVLGFHAASGTWRPQAPTTAASGSVTVDNSLEGDGSGGTPLQVRENAARYLETTASGLGLNDEGVTLLVRRFADAAARTAASPAPVTNSVSVLATAPGQLDYWTGSAWAPIVTAVGVETDGGEFLALSGAYAGGPTVQYTAQLSVETDIDGTFDVLSTAFLTAYAGVLSVHIQPSGAVAWIPMIEAGVDSVTATAWRLSTQAEYAGFVVTGTVTAILY